jgi:wyosine [tRNA(Phe)-imidazoG37] synthetase (radical SAM superfamily)
LLGSKGKYCPFDCVYCELGEGIHHIVRRKEFITITQLKAVLEQVKDTGFDYVTFSGSGEPTLASNLGEAIDLVKATLKKPVVVLTNSVLMTREDVRQDLGKADVVIAKIDAPDDETYRRIDKPWVRTPLREIIEAVKTFKSGYRGRLDLQMMFVEENKHLANEMAAVAREIAAGNVYLNTPLRDCPVPPLTRVEMAGIRKAFAGIKGVRMVYDT